MLLPNRIILFPNRNMSFPKRNMFSNRNIFPNRHRNRNGLVSLGLPHQMHTQYAADILYSARTNARIMAYVPEIHTTRILTTCNQLNGTIHTIQTWLNGTIATLSSKSSSLLSTRSSIMFNLFSFSSRSNWLNGRWEEAGREWPSSKRARFCGGMDSSSEECCDGALGGCDNRTSTLSSHSRLYDQIGISTTSSHLSFAWPLSLRL